MSFSISENPTLKFHLESNDIPIGPESHVHFHNCYHPGFHVHFHLKDPHGLGYLFPPNSDKRDAIWSVVGNGACPHSEAWEIFEPLNVSSDRKTLKVKNPNATEQGFGFTLNVTKTGGRPLSRTSIRAVQITTALTPCQRGKTHCWRSAERWPAQC